MNEPAAQDLLTGPEAFTVLWRKAGCSGDGILWYERLRAGWQSPGRAYHDWRHLGECLTEFDTVRESFPEANLPVVELAIWFHDIVYNPKAIDNEERSADLAVEALHEGGAAEDLVSAVFALVMATKSHNVPPGDLGKNTALLLDIDLSILGKPSERYWEYEEQIRMEYEWVPMQVFSEKRAEILQGFLSRPRLYLTEPFYDRYEATARSNLAAAIHHLRSLSG